jgi:hypothetical protein
MIALKLTPRPSPPESEQERQHLLVVVAGEQRDAGRGVGRGEERAAGGGREREAVRGQAPDELSDHPERGDQGTSVSPETSALCPRPCCKYWARVKGRA